MPDIKIYEAVIGLEVHVQLLTKSKLFCGDSTLFGNPPNTNISAVSLAHPGTLPVMNEKALELAIKLGLAFNCAISGKNYFDRKNYFYPDLPKGYQVTQQATPICKQGKVGITVNGLERSVQLNRIHLEEDAGKSIHDADEHYTCIDLNRAGVALLEIVSEPDIFSADEAGEYLTEVRKMIRFLDVSDGNMEEGSMRCDANISLRTKGETMLGTRVEVKNLNSIKNVKKAITHEIERLTNILNAGEEVIQQTRSFDATNGTTFSLRSKEEANDYRYFPEPDLPPFFVTENMLARIRSEMPELPAALEERMVKEYALNRESVKVICADKEMADYFLSAVRNTKNYKAVSNWIIGPIKNYLNENSMDISQFPIEPATISLLADIVEGGLVSFGGASTKVFPELIDSPFEDPMFIAKRLNILQQKDDGTLNRWIEETLVSMPDKVAQYKKGKKNLIGLFAGDVRRKSNGKADMATVNKLLIQKLNQ